MIKKHGTGYALYTKDGDRVLGVHKTKQEAVKQEQAIEIAKQKAAGKGKR